MKSMKPMLVAVKFKALTLRPWSRIRIPSGLCEVYTPVAKNSAMNF